MYRALYGGVYRKPELQLFSFCIGGVGVRKGTEENGVSRLHRRIALKPSTDAETSVFVAGLVNNADALGGAESTGLQQDCLLILSVQSSVCTRQSFPSVTSALSALSRGMEQRQNLRKCMADLLVFSLRICSVDAGGWTTRARLISVTQLIPATQPPIVTAS